jgi:antitoxin MazE
METVVKKWGNSAAVRIPAAVLEAARLGIDQSVEVREEQGRIVIEPVRPAAYSLAELVDGITKDNRHASVDTGPAVGGEVW